MRRLFFFFFFPTGALILFLDARVKSADVWAIMCPAKPMAATATTAMMAKAASALGECLAASTAIFRFSRLRPEKMLT